MKSEFQMNCDSLNYKCVPLFYLATPKWGW